MNSAVAASSPSAVVNAAGSGPAEFVELSLMRNTRRTEAVAYNRRFLLLY